MGSRDKKPLFHKHQKVFGSKKPTLKIIVSLKLSILLLVSKNNFKQINLNESLGFCLVGSSQDAFDALYEMVVPQRDPYIKTWKSAPVNVN